MNRNYIGLACTFHDPALAVVNSRGEIVFAEGMERPTQTKRALHCMPDSPSYLEKILEKHCEPDAELIVARSWSRTHTWRLRLVHRLNWLLRLSNGDLDPSTMSGAFWRYICTSQIHSMAVAGEGVILQAARRTLRQSATLHTERPRVKPVELIGFDHHLSHAAAAAWTSPFGESVVAVVDGYGELGTTAFYRHEGAKLTLLRSRRSYGSLGLYYSQLCNACGFDSLRGEEWKVMGLAPYGECDEVVYNLLKSMFLIEGLRVVPVNPRGGAQKIWESLADIPPQVLAFTGQLVFEEWMTMLLRNLADLKLSENLVLIGGCALNSSYNGTILERTPFRALHVFAAPADDGNAIGSALLAYRRDHPEWVPPVGVHTPYLGSSLSREALKNLVQFDSGKHVSEHPGTIHKIAARALADGKIIGWVQGRAEFGPRALGNRSILADPRHPGIKDRINARVKFREEFRPFAPAILHEHGPEYFEHYQEAPYMERTLRFRPEVIDRVPGVVHVNKTGRLQTVRREWNERFHDLVQEFHALTGVPVVLNTSFNVMGKPIIHTVEDALAVLHTTGLDAVALEDYWVEK
ncbi:MAG TPA: carbamoyltransferase C-terminal domain-containing protein [Gemmataceae bacterium]